MQASVCMFPLQSPFDFHSFSSCALLPFTLPDWATLEFRVRFCLKFAWCLLFMKLTQQHQPTTHWPRLPMPGAGLSGAESRGQGPRRRCSALLRRGLGWACRTPLAPCTHRIASQCRQAVRSGGQAPRAPRPSLGSCLHHSAKRAWLPGPRRRTCRCSFTSRSAFVTRPGACWRPWSAAWAAWWAATPI